MKTLRAKYQYGLNDRARVESTNIRPVGLHFQSISRSVAKTARPRQHQNQLQIRL